MVRRSGRIAAKNPRVGINARPSRPIPEEPNIDQNPQLASDANDHVGNQLPAQIEVPRTAENPRPLAQLELPQIAGNPPLVQDQNFPGNQVLPYQAPPPMPPFINSQAPQQMWQPFNMQQQPNASQLLPNLYPIPNFNHTAHQYALQPYNLGIMNPFQFYANNFSIPPTNGSTTYPPPQSIAGSNTIDPQINTINDVPSVTAPEQRYIPLGIVMKYIPEFDGKNNSNVKKFSTICRDAYERTNPSDRGFLINFIQTKVTGDASKYLSDGPISNLDQILLPLSRAFESDKSLLHLKTQLLNSKQSSSESILEFGAKITKLLEDILHTYKISEGTEHLESFSQMMKHDALKSFVRGLHHYNLCSNVSNQFPKTLEEAIDIAKKENDKRNDYLEIRPEMKNRGQRNDLVAVHAIQARKDIRERRCFGCSSVDHMFQKCPNKQNTECTYCKKKGHPAVWCQTRKRDEEVKAARESNETDSANLNAQVAPQAGAAGSKSVIVMRQGSTESTTYEIPK